jgi:NADPH:quinone reductase
MRAIRLSEFGSPFGNTDGLSLENIPTPEPNAGEVRVRLTHRPVHPADFFVIAGLYPVKPPELPGSPGLEGLVRAGENLLRGFPSILGGTICRTNFASV